MKALTASTLRPIEVRVLEFLVENGDSHRSEIASALAAAGTKTGARNFRGSNGAVPLMVGRWCHRLEANGHVVVDHHPGGQYLRHGITMRGRKLLREALALVRETSAP